MSEWVAAKRLPSGVAAAAAIWGVGAALYYHRAGLTLSHYDARGHLVVARRILDSITPGWQQIGAVWLPLPHLLNALPVQIDAFYRSGASAVAISIASFALATAAIAAIVLAVTDSAAAAISGAAVFALNPNVVYLQSTPMTEPLLLATVTVAVAMLMRTRDFRLQTSDFRLPGLAFALACLTRYEAWPVTVCVVALMALARWRQGEPLADAARAAGRVAVYPAGAIVAFAIFSRVVVGQWFVSSDFFVPENKSLGLPALAAKEIGWGLRMLSGDLALAAGVLGLATLAVLAAANRRHTAHLLPLALATMALIPWTAFEKGHPFRIRYMVPLIAIEAIGAGVLAGIVRRLRIAGAIVILAICAYELRPLDAAAPMVVEAQWDRPNVADRSRVTACLGGPGRGEKIMASMGSLGHYMQEASLAGFAVRDFLHEGNGDIWLAALDRPRPFAEWVLIEEKAEGGDVLARIARERPAFLEGYARACEGAGLALYRRKPKT